MAPTDENISVVYLLLQNILPKGVADSIHTYALHPSSPVQVVKRNALHVLQGLFETVYPLVQPGIDAAVRLLADSPEVVSLGVFVVALALALVVLNWIRRVMMWWARAAARIAFWAGFGLLLSVVWRRGLYQSALDAVAIWGRIVGFAFAMKEVWVGEYRRYEEQERMQARRPGRSR